MLRIITLTFFGATALFAQGVSPASPLETTTLHNVFRIDDDLFSGNVPDSDGAFQELAKLGVKLIISVDGGKPNLDLARKYGMRYVHLPIGYDGVPKSRGVELVKAAQTAGGPIYMHCHHGKHRGPAAVAIVCRALRDWGADRAEEFLKQAGTAPEYAGLFRDVRVFEPPSPEALAKLPATFQESVQAPPMVDAMIAIDENFGALKAAQKVAWREIPGHPDHTPIQAATLVWEGFREVARDSVRDKHGPDFRTKLTAAEEASDALRALLRAPTDAAQIDAAFKHATHTCADCHKKHRN